MKKTKSNAKNKKKTPNSLTDFKVKVFAVVQSIPKGQTLTYKEVAKLSGRLGAYRAVGNILKTNFDPKIPCHRVVRSDGTTGGYNRGRILKIKKLKNEGAIK